MRVMRNVMRCRSAKRCARVMVMVMAGLLVSCTDTVPQDVQDVIDAIESIDRDLSELRAAEFAPEEYAAFAKRWMVLKARVEMEEDLIRWPWESNHLEQELRRLQDEGSQTVSRVNEQRESQRQAAEAKLARVEERVLILNANVGSIDSRIVLGPKPVQTDLLVKQARSFFEQGQYERSLEASDQAARILLAQAEVLSTELGRYADEERISRWQQMAKQTIEWSRVHQASAVIVSKADRVLAVYKNGRKVQSYPVRLGFNGIREKRYQGDGATPEGRYKISIKRGLGQTQFYRALVLDYPNAEDRRRFRLAQRAGRIPVAKDIGGQIEIHGVDNELMAQTLGCIMLDNQHMVSLFQRVERGTPVTIVGALNSKNSVALALSVLADQQEET